MKLNRLKQFKIAYEKEIAAKARFSNVDSEVIEQVVSKELSKYK